MPGSLGFPLSASAIIIMGYVPSVQNLPSFDWSSVGELVAKALPSIKQEEKKSERFWCEHVVVKVRNSNKAQTSREPTSTLTSVVLLEIGANSAILSGRRCFVQDSAQASGE